MIQPPEEVELKLRVEPAHLRRLQGHPRIRELTHGDVQRRQVRSVYFDTGDLDLAQRGLGLRVRRVGRAYVQTLKTRESPLTGLFRRSEHEARLDEDRPDLARIPEPHLRQRLVRELSGRELEPIFETCVRRTHRLLREDGLELGFDLDVGEVRAGSRSLPICELELELRAGEPGSLFRLALDLARNVDLRPARESKVESGYALVTGEGPQPRKADRLHLERDAPVHRALWTIVAACLDQILANELPACEGADPEGVHQLRVGVRRLRSALVVFRPVVGAGRRQALETELRWLGRALGPARDLDVFVDEVIAPVVRLHPDDAGLRVLRHAAVELREEHRAQVRETLRSPRFGRLGLEIGHWLTLEPWRDELPEAKAALLFGPASAYAAAILDRRDAKARRLGGRLARASSAERHALRIQLKKLRYAGEFFRGLFPQKRADRYLGRLADLQDVLGQLNDVATAQRILAELVTRVEPTPDHHRVAGFVAGWASHFAERRLRRLGRRWHAFEATVPFWRSGGGA